MTALNELAANYVGDAPGDVRAACPLCASKANDDAVNITVNSDGTVVAHCHRCGKNGTARPHGYNGNGRHTARKRSAPRPPEHEFETLWAAASEVGETTAHEYLTRKQINPYGLRIHGEVLLVPMRNSDGVLTGVQRIYPNGKKLHAKGSIKKGAYHLIGEGADQLLIAEGYATASTLHEATGFPVAVAFDAGNMTPVAEALHSKFPNVQIIACADDDWQTAGNPGVTNATIAAQAVGGSLAVPDFSGVDRGAADSDFNDLHRLRGADAVSECVAAAREIISDKLWRLPDPIGTTEWASARLSPQCVVEHYLYADVAVLIAPGSTGKTTLILYESVCIVLGLPLYGLRVHTPGSVLILTAEDSREMLVARLRCICDALDLTDEQKDRVRDGVRISDLSGEAFKLTRIVEDMIVATHELDALIREAKALVPVLIVIDPTVSFGVGEQRVNDAEQALIDAARRIRHELGCCLRFIHHSGKQNARDKTLDQYSGRGGSTMADGARMVAVLQPLDADEWKKATGSSLLESETAMVLARPKLSYLPPQPDILINRKGYTFTHTGRIVQSKSEELELNCAQIVRRLIADEGKHHTQNSLQALDLGMARAQVRDAVQTLIARGRVEQAVIEPKPAHGQRTYLRPVAAPTNSAGNGAAGQK